MIRFLAVALLATTLSAQDPPAPRPGGDAPQQGEQRPPREERGASRDGEDAGQPLSDRQKSELRDAVAELKKRLSSASGDEKERLQRQIARAEKVLESGVLPARERERGRWDRGERGDRGDRGDRGERGDRGDRGRMRIEFAQMSDQDIEQTLQRMEQFQDEMLGRMRERGDGERADEIAKQWQEMKKLLDAGKKDEAQKIFDDLMRSMMGGRRG